MGYPDGFYLTACRHLPKKLSGAILALSGGYEFEEGPLIGMEKLFP
jgi:hypothetical protein